MHQGMESGCVQHPVILTHVSCNSLREAALRLQWHVKQFISNSFLQTFPFNPKQPRSRLSLTHQDRLLNSFLFWYFSTQQAISPRFVSNFFPYEGEGGGEMRTPHFSFCDWCLGPWFCIGEGSERVVGSILSLCIFFPPTSLWIPFPVKEIETMGQIIYKKCLAVYTLSAMLLESLGKVLRTSSPKDIQPSNGAWGATWYWEFRGWLAR